MNPDGFVVTQTSNRMHRKNAQSNGGCLGTDSRCFLFLILSTSCSPTRLQTRFRFLLTASFLSLARDLTFNSEPQLGFQVEPGWFLDRPLRRRLHGSQCLLLTRGHQHWQLPEDDAQRCQLQYVILFLYRLSYNHENKTQKI